MLVPVVWFEESAMIPEESAKKFRSLYTDRIRLVNIVLLSLFLAALGLLAIDIRLIAAHYANCYRRFKMTDCKEKFSSKVLAAAAKKSGVIGANNSTNTNGVLMGHKLTGSTRGDNTNKALLSSAASKLLIKQPLLAAHDGNHAELNNGNKSVEFAVRYNDTMTLVSSSTNKNKDSGQQQVQTNRLENNKSIINFVNKQETTKTTTTMLTASKSSGKNFRENQAGFGSESSESGRTSTTTLPEHEQQQQQQY